MGRVWSLKCNWTLWTSSSHRYSDGGKQKHEICMLRLWMLHRTPQKYQTARVLLSTNNQMWYRPVPLENGSLHVSCRNTKHILWLYLNQCVCYVCPLYVLVQTIGFKVWIECRSLLSRLCDWHFIILINIETGSWEAVNNAGTATGNNPYICLDDKGEEDRRLWYRKQTVLVRFGNWAGFTKIINKKHDLFKTICLMLWLTHTPSF